MSYFLCMGCTGDRLFRLPSRAVLCIPKRGLHVAGIARCVVTSDSYAWRVVERLRSDDLVFVKFVSRRKIVFLSERGLRFRKLLVGLDAALSEALLG